MIRHSIIENLPNVNPGETGIYNEEKKLMTLGIKKNA